jgi:hypothetical protein
VGGFILEKLCRSKASLECDGYILGIIDALANDKVGGSSGASAGDGLWRRGPDLSVLQRSDRTACTTTLERRPLGQRTWVPVSSDDCFALDQADAAWARYRHTVCPFLFKGSVPSLASLCLHSIAVAEIWLAPLPIVLAAFVAEPRRRGS